MVVMKMIIMNGGADEDGCHGNDGCFYGDNGCHGDIENYVCGCHSDDSCHGEMNGCHGEMNGCHGDDERLS